MCKLSHTGNIMGAKKILKNQKHNQMIFHIKTLDFHWRYLPTHIENI